MKILRFLSLIFLFQSLFPIAFAHSESLKFMTPRDLLKSDANSLINLQNNRPSAVTVYGLYISQFAYVLPGDTCDHATPIYPATQNITAGSVVMPIKLDAGKSAAIGSNYLYNMVYGAIYYTNNASLPYTCAVPGCTWGSDATQYNWCIYLGALSPVTTSTGYTANVPPATSAVSDVGYNYNLVQDYIYLGPISCNDKKLTCMAASLQTQSFS